MLTKKWMTLLLAVELVIVLLLLLLFVFRGELHVDEPGYVYAARQISEGLVPYHDFLFLQTPVFPYVYAIPFFFMPTTFIMARLTMMLFGIGTIILTIILGYRMGGRSGAVLVGFLYIVTPFQLQFFSIARNYPLVTFWICSGLVFLTSKPAALWKSCVTMIFFCIAMGTRLTLLPLPFLYLAYLFLERGLLTRKFIVPFLAGCVTLFTIIYPFYIPDPARFTYNIIGFHLDISVGGFLTRMLLKVIGVSRLAESYFTIFLFAAFAVAVLFFWKEHPLRSRPWNEKTRHLLFMACVVLVIGLGQFTARFFQASYQAVLFPLLAVLVAALLAPIESILANATVRKLTLVSLVLGGLVAFAGQGLSGLVYESGNRDIRQARIIARYLEQQTSPDDVIFSADSPLIPFMANRTIMKHSVAPEYYPFWSDDRVEYLGIFNHRLLKKMFEEQVPDYLLMSSKSFHVIMPYRTMTPPKLRDDLWDQIREKYTLLKSFPNVMTPGDETLVYRRREVIDNSSNTAVGEGGS